MFNHFTPPLLLNKAMAVLNWSSHLFIFFFLNRETLDDIICNMNEAFFMNIVYFVGGRHQSRCCVAISDIWILLSIFCIVKELHIRIYEISRQKPRVSASCSVSYSIIRSVKVLGRLFENPIFTTKRPTLGRNNSRFPDVYPQFL